MRKVYRINPAEFRHKISVLRPTIRKDEDDRPIEILSPILENIKAKVVNLKGKESNSDNSVYYFLEKKMYIRKPKNLDILETDYIMYKDTKYNITYVNNIDELDKYYELSIKVVK